MTRAGLRTSCFALVAFSCALAACGGSPPVGTPEPGGEGAEGNEGKIIFEGFEGFAKPDAGLPQACQPGTFFCIDDVAMVCDPDGKALPSVKCIPPQVCVNGGCALPTPSDGGAPAEDAEGVEGIEGQEGTEGTEGSEGSEGQEGAEGNEGFEGVEGQEGTEGFEGIEGGEGPEGDGGVDGGEDAGDGGDGGEPIGLPDGGGPDAGLDGGFDAGFDAGTCSPVNACGGCGALAAPVGGPCGDCGLWVCNGADNVKCEDPGKKKCVNYLTCTLYEKCGACEAKPPEICDGKDNDCDPNTPENNVQADCAAGQLCRNGACCADECTGTGENICQDGASYKTCGNFDPDGCLELGPKKFCNSGQVCENGACITLDAGIVIQDAGIDAGIDSGVQDAGIDGGVQDAGIDSGIQDAGIDAGVQDAGATGGPDGGKKKCGEDCELNEECLPPATQCGIITHKCFCP